MEKYNVLVWSDSVTARTGFGNVARNILKHVYSTGLFEFDQFAINFFGDFYNREEFPYQIVPAILKDSKDPYGSKAFLEFAQSGKYDVIFIINDSFSVSHVAEKLVQIQANLAGNKRKHFSLVYYFPIDCHLQKQHMGMVEAADFPVTYTKFAMDECKKTLPPQVFEKLTYIYHGVDGSVYHKIPDRDVIKVFRRDILKVPEDKFLFVNVNRNSLRKDIARTLLAYRAFREKHQDNILYIHADPIDNGLNLIQIAADLNFSEKCVNMPMGIYKNPAYTDSYINMVYNAADAFVSTTLGEGWSLTTTECMSSECIYIGPNNTSLAEILGENSERGFLVKSGDILSNMTVVDSSGFRPQTNVEDLVEKMDLVYNMVKSNDPKIEEVKKNAKQFCIDNSWQNVCEKWKEVFIKAALKSKQELITKAKVM